MQILCSSGVRRTREIGVRLAIGATQKSILNQFILEGLILVAVRYEALGLMVVFSGRVAWFHYLTGWLGFPVITREIRLLCHCW
ncbi:FtsX-like permease family protein [Vibrio chagasii]|nr:FtsX-like permease family protein [Vibrio chagasii]